MRKSLATLLAALILFSCGWTPACIAEPTETDAVWEQVSEAYHHRMCEHGDLKIPANYVVNGVWLARWFSEQKARLNGKSTGRSGKKPLTKDQKEKLRSLDIRRGRVG